MPSCLVDFRERDPRSRAPRSPRSSCSSSLAVLSPRLTHSLFLPTLLELDCPALHILSSLVPAVAVVVAVVHSPSPNPLLSSLHLRLLPNEAENESDIVLHLPAPAEKDDSIAPALPWAHLTSRQSWGLEDKNPSSPCLPLLTCKRKGKAEEQSDTLTRPCSCIAQRVSRGSQGRGLQKRVISELARWMLDPSLLSDPIPGGIGHLPSSPDGA